MLAANPMGCIGAPFDTLQTSALEATHDKRLINLVRMFGLSDNLI
jgi:hypothetical protein